MSDLILKTMLFDLYESRYNTIEDLASAMGLSVDYLNKVKNGECVIDERFTQKTLEAFPDLLVKDLFYFTI